MSARLEFGLCYIITLPKQLEVAVRSLTIANDNSGQMLAFPLSRQAARVRRTVDAVVRRHGIEADWYWRRMIAEKRAEMVAAGMPEGAVECELRSFSDSVFSIIDDWCA